MAEIRELVLTFLERLSHNALPENRKRKTRDACISTRKLKGLDSREITSLPDIEKVIYMARLLNHRRK